jgi:hypothetical protein
MVLAAALVLIPRVPLGLLTEGVQTLAGVLLPSATVFLLLLCNDRDVLGPWVNSRRVNAFTASVVWVLVLLSIVLTASVLFPNISSGAIVGVLVGGVIVGLLLGTVMAVLRHRGRAGVVGVPVEWHDRKTWRMPPLNRLARPPMSLQRKIGLITLRGYLLVAFSLVVVKIVEVAVH